MAATQYLGSFGLWLLRQRILFLFFCVCAVNTVIYAQQATFASYRPPTRYLSSTEHFIVHVALNNTTSEVRKFSIRKGLLLRAENSAEADIKQSFVVCGIHEDDRDGGEWICMGDSACVFSFTVPPGEHKFVRLICFCRHYGAGYPGRLTAGKEVSVFGSIYCCNDCCNKSPTVSPPKNNKDIWACNDEHLETKIGQIGDVCIKERTGVSIKEVWAEALKRAVFGNNGIKHGNTEITFNESSFSFHVNKRTGHLIVRDTPAVLEVNVKVTCGSDIIQVPALIEVVAETKSLTRNAKSTCKVRLAVKVNVRISRSDYNNLQEFISQHEQTGCF